MSAHAFPLLHQVFPNTPSRSTYPPTRRIATDICTDSQVPYYLGSPHLNGLDRLLPDNDPASSASAAEHAEIRPRREEEGAVPGAGEEWEEITGGR